MLRGIRRWGPLKMVGRAKGREAMRLLCPVPRRYGRAHTPRLGYAHDGAPAWLVSTICRARRRVTPFAAAIHVQVWGSSKQSRWPRAGSLRDLCAVAMGVNTVTVQK